MSDGLWKDDKTGKTQNKLEFLTTEFIPLMRQMVPVNSSKTWLPAMTSTLICTEALLTLYDVYVAKGGYLNLFKANQCQNFKLKRCSV